MDAVMKLASALRNETKDMELEDELNKMSAEDLADILRNFDTPVEKKASVEEGSLALIRLADAWGRELVKTALPSMGLGQKLVGGAMKAAITQPTATRALVGAGVGAAGGALAGGPNHRLSGAVGGAALGGLAGAGANRGAMALGSMNNRVGRYAGGALKQVAKQSPTVATSTGTALNAAKQMQMNRMAQGGVSRYMSRQTAAVGTKRLPAPG